MSRMWLSAYQGCPCAVADSEVVYILAAEAGCLTLSIVFVLTLTQINCSSKLSPRNLLNKKSYITVSWIKIGSFVYLYAPVSPSVPEMEYICHWGLPFFFFFRKKCTFGGVYVPCIYSHARWSWRFRSVVVSFVCWALLNPFVVWLRFWRVHLWTLSWPVLAFVVHSRH